MSKTSKNLIVFYDGGCPLCRREIHHYMRLDKNRQIEWKNIASEPEITEAYNLKWETTMKRMHVINTNGDVASGAHAFVAIWNCLPFYNKLAKLIIKTNMSNPLDLLYTKFSEYRWLKRCNTSCHPKHE